jgi:DNA (cytosine-5)-methyltransferase 1
MLRAIDLFCGAGGTTTGVEQSGRVKVVAAVNHWTLAVETHKANHPETQHVCASIDHVDPKDFLGLGIDLILASPECVFHSRARGGKPVDDQRRATAWCVPRWAEVLRPKWIVIENVREFVDWGPLGSDDRPLKSRKGEIFKAWIGALEALNYRVEWRVLNAADYGGATHRRRLFIIARRGRKKIQWPEPTHCHREKIGGSLFGDLQPYRVAADCIDWSKPCPSIFSRKKSLAENTLRRIEVGIRKFAEPFIIGAGGSGYAGKPRGVDQPLNTVKCDNHSASAIPFLVPTPYLIDVNHGDYGRSGDRAQSIDEPLGTVTTHRGKAVVVPFLLPRQGYYDCGKDKPCKSIDEPLGTVAANHSPAHIIVPFLTEYFATGGASSVDEPLSTITTKHRHSLALVELMRDLGVADIGFRMLDDDELAAAQGFPRGYRLLGNKADRVKQIGNSVHTAVACAIATAIAA